VLKGFLTLNERLKVTSVYEYREAGSGSRDHALLTPCHRVWIPVHRIKTSLIPKNPPESPPPKLQCLKPSRVNSGPFRSRSPLIFSFPFLSLRHSHPGPPASDNLRIVPGNVLYSRYSFSCTRSGSWRISDKTLLVQRWSVCKRTSYDSIRTW
jgi:hypothetical protein